MTLSIERADRRMGLASDRTVYSSKRNRPLLLYGRLLDDSRPSHGLTATNPDYFLFADNPGVNRFGQPCRVTRDRCRSMMSPEPWSGQSAVALEVLHGFFMRVMVGERPEQVTPRDVPFRQFRIQRQRILHGGKRFLLPLFSLWVDDKSLRPVFAPQGRIGGCELGIAS